jgi:hypothetical protein
VQHLPHVADLKHRVQVCEWHEAKSSVGNRGEDGMRGCGLREPQQVSQSAREKLVVALELLLNWACVAQEVRRLRVDVGLDRTQYLPGGEAGAQQHRGLFLHLEELGSHHEAALDVVKPVADAEVGVAGVEVERWEHLIVELEDKVCVRRWVAVSVSRHREGRALRGVRFHRAPVQKLGHAVV